ncbi:hypothetical protein NDU88_002531 [Pleurodeles waltl]|uniref:Rx N-terminal domain-containing protein n=1 Tax=Pleurodeles waltl TaxID=8319 RepID=A0AAV7UBI6_PLEWA|nr:hypothetical protein NDU88_002531 [Pleurodeles waltl]
MTAELLAAIQGSCVALGGKMDSIARDINHLRLDLRKVADHLPAVKDDVDALKKEVKWRRAEVDESKCSATQMEERLEDTKDQSRCNNLHFMGFTRRAEGSSVELFLEHWTTKSLRLLKISNFFMVERGHRALAPVPHPGAPPRTLIALFNYRYNHAILQYVRTYSPPQIRGQTDLYPS